MTSINCSIYNNEKCNSSSNNCYWYNYGSLDSSGGSCIDKTQIIPISSYIFQAYQKKIIENNNKYIDIYINKYKNSNYISLTNEPIVKSINITLVYNNGKSTRSIISMPTNYISPAGYISITNPNITQPDGLPTTTQSFTFSIPTGKDGTSYNKSSIPTYFRLDISKIASNDDVDKIIVKNIQYTDTNDNKSILINVKDVNEDELTYMHNILKISEKVNSAKKLKDENDNLIKYIQNRTGYKLTFT